MCKSEKAGENAGKRTSHDYYQSACDIMWKAYELPTVQERLIIPVRFDLVYTHKGDEWLRCADGTPAIGMTGCDSSGEQGRITTIGFIRNGMLEGNDQVLGFELQTLVHFLNNRIRDPHSRWEAN